MDFENSKIFQIWLTLEYIGNFTQKYLTWKSFLYSFELEFYSVLLVFTQNYSKLVFFGNSILDSLYTRLMKATRVRVSTSVKKEVLVSEYSREWVLSDHTTSHSAYVATETKSNGAKIDGLLPPNFL